ncbi:MAG: hypothetical protein L0I24_03585 [Pseudonocardia sp.]|nr:hypothetical protein [Pseudonocardia sp.]
MFDPIAPARLVAMLGQLLRDSAQWDRPLDEFQTSQLLSASSLARYLSVEIDGSGSRLAWFAGEADAVLATALLVADEPGWRAALESARVRLVTDSSKVSDPAAFARVLGAAGVDVLAAARATDDPGGAAFATSFRRVLAGLADRHVELLGQVVSR